MPDEALPTLAQPQETQEQVVEQAAQVAANVETPETETPDAGDLDAEQQEQREPLDLPEGWQETEPAKALRAEGYQEAQSKLEKAHQRQLREARAEHAQQREQAVEAAVAGSVVLKVGELISELQETEDPERAEKLLTRLFRENASWAAAFNQQNRQFAEQQGIAKGVSQASTLLYHGLSKELGEDFADTVDELSLQIREGTIKQDAAFRKLLERRDELVREDERKNVEKMVGERQKEEARAAQRNGKAPPAKTAGVGSRSNAVRWTTKMEARSLHVQGKLTNAEMKAINADPSVPEM